MRGWGFIEVGVLLILAAVLVMMGSVALQRGQVEDRMHAQVWDLQTQLTLGSLGATLMLDGTYLKMAGEVHAAAAEASALELLVYQIGLQRDEFWAESPQYMKKLPNLGE